MLARGVDVLAWRPAWFGPSSLFRLVLANAAVMLPFACITATLASTSETSHSFASQATLAIPGATGRSHLKCSDRRMHPSTPSYLAMCIPSTTASARITA